MRWNTRPEYEHVPRDWQVVPFASVAEVNAGQSPSSSYYNERGEGLPFLQGNADFGDEFPKPTVWCTGAVKTADAGDVLVSVRAPVGELNRADQTYAIGRGVAALKATCIDPDFLYYGMHLWSKSLQRAGQGSTFDAVTSRHFRQLLIAKPDDLEEQRAIAKVLKTADEAINATKKEIEATERLKRSLMQQLFTKGIPGRHRSFRQLRRGTVPEAWERLKLKECGLWGSGGTPDRSNQSFYGGTIPWVKSGEVKYNTVTDTEEKITEKALSTITCDLLPLGTLLIAMYGAGVTRGRVALLGVSAAINQAIAWFQGDTFTDNRFLYYWFERNYHQVRELASGANQDNLSTYLLKNFWFFRPAMSEQQEIVEILSSVDANLDNLSEELLANQRLKQSLLQNLLTGRVRVGAGVAA